MKNKSQLSPSLPKTEPRLSIGFTVWTELHRRTVAEVRSFHQPLDGHLAGKSLVSSMNPLHTMIWLPTRDMTAVNQVTRLAFAAAWGRATQVEIGGVRTQIVPVEIALITARVSRYSMRCSRLPSCRLSRHGVCGRGIGLLAKLRQAQSLDSFVPSVSVH